MTVDGIKEEVLKKFHEGQEASLWMKEAEREDLKQTKVMIIKFYPSYVHIKKGEFNSGLTYFELLKMSKPPVKEKSFHIPKGPSKRHYKRTKFK